MKKISFILLGVIIFLSLSFGSVKASFPEIKFTEYEKVESGSYLEPGYYIVRFLLQDPAIDEYNFDQPMNYYRSYGKVNENYFTEDNVEELLLTYFNATASTELLEFLPTVTQVSTRRWAASLILLLEEGVEYDDLETSTDKSDFYRLSYEKVPVIATSDEVHVLNYDEFITLDQIKSTYSAYDNYDRDITSKIEFVSNYPSDPKDAKIDTEYYISASVTDSSNNTTTVINKIIVKDITAPKFSKEVLSYELDYGTSFTLDDIYKELTCTDNYEGSISNSLWNVSNSINLELLGTQSITISYTDSSGNTGSCLVNIKIVDNEAPVISVMPIEISTTNPLSEEEILKLLVSTNRIDSNYVSYKLTTNYFEYQDVVGSHVATLSLDYEDGTTKTYRFTINVLENIDTVDTTNTNIGIYITIAICVFLLVGGGLGYYLYYRKKNSN